MSAELPFRIATAIVFAGFVLHRAYYNRRFPAEQADTLESQTKSRADQLAGLLALPALAGTVLYIINPAWMAWASLPLPDWLRWLGLVLAGAGFALLQWAHLALDSNWSDQPRIMADQTLTVSGPYQWIRHPMYTAFFLILGSSFLITANWFIGGLWIALVALDARSRIRYEEAKLEERFGADYALYKQATGALIPRL